MDKIEALHISFTMKDMKCLSEEETVFFFQLGALIQEIVSLQKYIHMSSHGVSHKWERAAENAQAMYFLRALSGTLFEAWRTLQLDRYRAVKAKYKPQLDQVALEAADNFAAYFEDSNNLCEKIRNNHSHHYNYGEIRNQIREWPKDEKLDLILSEQHGNCRYLASDALINFSIIGVTEIEAAMKGYLAEVLMVANHFVNLAGSYVSLILRLIQSETTFKSAEVVIENIPRLDEVRLNYFVSK